MSDCFKLDGYDYKQLMNDYQHIHVYHMINNDKMQKLICMELNNRFLCPVEKCNLIHRRSREYRATIKMDKQGLFMAKLDDIHSYFLQFSDRI